MQDVPKIVRERLKVAMPAAQHPDADALTAFAERSLPQRERALVLDHLARCSDCRDIVAFALPATERVETIGRPPAREWLIWPTLRWGFVAAGVVAIASLGIVRYQRGVGRQGMASKSPARVEVAAKEAKNEPLARSVASADERDKIQTPPAAAFTRTVDSTSAIGGAKKGMAREEPTSVLALQPQVNRGSGIGSGRSLVVGGPFPHGPKMANQWQQQNVIQNQAPSVPPSPFAKQQAAGDLSANMQVPAVSETVAVEAQSAQSMQTQNLDAGQIQDQPAAPQPAHEDYALDRVGKAKPAATTQTGRAVPPVSIGGGSVLPSSAPVPRWTINSTGGLQRSFDQGITWQAINVNGNPAYSTDATSVQITANTPRARRKDASPALKRDAASPLFRAVAANGADVWAGGSGGVLYHSQDAGDHWTRVVPASAGATLTGDIVSLEFPDLQHGRVSTSAAEIWTTTDEGQTWQKQ
jgi:Photosynthesis system II assembly factor YCF48